MDSALIIGFIVAILGAGGLGGFLGSRANAAKAISEAVEQLANSYGTRLLQVERYQIRQSKYSRYLLKGIKELVAQIDGLGGIPIWQPEDMDIVCPPESE